MAHPSLPRRGASPPAIAALLPVLLLGMTLALAACGSASTTTGATAISATSTSAGATSPTAVSSTTSGDTAIPQEEAPYPVQVTDDASTTSTVAARPQRIVSTVPANTEILFAIGAGPRVVGTSSMDDFPPEALALPKIGTFEVNTEAVVALDPDLVVGWTGNADALKSIKDRGVPLLLFAPESLRAVYANIKAVGDAVGQPKAAAQLVQKIQVQIEGITNSAADLGESPKVFYALDNTLWTVGPGSFVDELIRLAGATNVGASGPQAFYQFTPEQLVAADPDMILLPNTAFTSTDEFLKDPRFADLRAVKDGKVMLVNDTIITRPGPRIAEGLKSLAMSIHPGATF